MLILPLAHIVITTSMLPGAVQKRRFHLALLLKTEDVMIPFFLTITYFLQSIIQ